SLQNIASWLPCGRSSCFLRYVDVKCLRAFFRLLHRLSCGAKDKHSAVRRSVKGPHSPLTRPIFSRSQRISTTSLSICADWKRFPAISGLLGILDCAIIREDIKRKRSHVGEKEFS